MAPRCRDLRASPGSAQYVTLQKCFSHPSLVIYFFPNTTPQPPPRKKTNQSETGSSSQIIFITLFSGRCTRCEITSNKKLLISPKCAETVAQNHFAEPNQDVLTSLHPIFNFQSHTLSTPASAQEITNLGKMLGQKHFAEPNQHVLTFFIQFYCAGSHTEYYWGCSYNHKGNQ